MGSVYAISVNETGSTISASRWSLSGFIPPVMLKKELPEVAPADLTGAAACNQKKAPRTNHYGDNSHPSSYLPPRSSLGVAPSLLLAIASGSVFVLQVDNGDYLYVGLWGLSNASKPEPLKGTGTSTASVPQNRGSHTQEHRGGDRRTTTFLLLVPQFLLHHLRLPRHPPPPPLDKAPEGPELLGQCRGVPVAAPQLPLLLAPLCTLPLPDALYPPPPPPPPVVA